LDQLLEPFRAAVEVALREWANTEVVVRQVDHQGRPPAADDISAMIALRGACDRSLVLSFPARTAAGLAGRILADVRQDVEDALIGDCLGEVANVVAGQAKALLAGTPDAFVFSTPTVVVGPRPEILPHQGGQCLAITFSSDVGDFALQLI
jgi:chemotaxis protein CheX